MLIRRLSAKERRKSKPKITVTVAFDGIKPHAPAERLEISKALTVVAGAWFPEDKSTVRVNLDYRR